MARAIKIASLIWGLSMLLSRVIGLVREIVIGRVLGSGSAADVYWTAFVIPDFLGYLLAGGALSLVFIPIFHRYMSAGDEEGGWRVFSTIANFLLISLVLLTTTLWFWTPSLVPHIAPGFDAAQQAQLTHLVRIILPAQIFHLLGGLLSAVLQAKDRHTLPALAPLLYSGGIVVLGVALGPTMGAEGFAWGVLVGSILGPFTLPLVGCLRLGLRWRPTFNFKDADFRQYLLLMLPIMLGQSIVVVDDWFFRIFGSSQPEGTVSQLQYAKTLMRVPMGVFGLATAAAAFPTLSRLVAEGKRGEAWEELMTATRSMLVLAFAAQAALTVAGTEVATVIYGRGRFNEEALAEIGLYTAVLCLGLWAWSAQNLISRGFYAMQNTWTPTLTGTVVMVVSYPLYSLAASHRGGLGLALASSLAISAYTGVILWQLRTKLVPPGHRMSPVVGPLLKMALATAVGVAGGELVDRGLGGWPALLRGGVSGGVAMGVMLASAWALKVEEVAQVVSRITQAIRRRVKR